MSNNEIKIFHQNFGYDLEATLAIYPIKELAGEVVTVCNSICDVGGSLVGARKYDFPLRAVCEYTKYSQTALCFLEADLDLFRGNICTQYVYLYPKGYNSYLFNFFIPDRVYFLFFILFYTRKGINRKYSIPLYPKGYIMSLTITNSISSFVKYNRGRLKVTQEELAEKAGVGLRFIRDLEQGKETLRMDKVNQVLALFGYQVSPAPGKIMDPYDILLNHMNRSVRIKLKDKTERIGIILGQFSENNEIRTWRFVSNNNAIEYQKTEDPNLETVIDHANIEAIENIKL